MRINEVPASSGYGEPIAKFFRLGDQVRRSSAPSRPTNASRRRTAGRRNGEPPAAVPAGRDRPGPVAARRRWRPFRTASTKRGPALRAPQRRRPGRAGAAWCARRRRIFLASRDGHVIHFPIDEINILSGVGKGVIGIKLEDDDTCLGGALIRNQNDAMIVETSGGKRMEFYGSREQTGRGGKGFEAVKRTSFVRVVPPAIELVNWEEIEARG